MSAVSRRGRAVGDLMEPNMMNLIVEMNTVHGLIIKWLDTSRDGEGRVQASDRAYESLLVAPALPRRCHETAITVYVQGPLFNLAK